MKRFLCSALALLTACSLWSGCSIAMEEAQNNEKSGYCFYYLNAEETSLKKEAYEPEEETTAFMVKDLMQRLGKKPGKGKISTCFLKRFPLILIICRITCW